MNKLLVESAQIVLGQIPVDLSTAGANGGYVSLANYGRCAVVLVKGAGTAGDDPTITLLQAQDNAGTGAKALTINRVDKKQGVQTSIGQFATSTPDAPLANDTFANNTFTNSALAEAAAVIVIDVKAEDLDANGGFGFIKASIADVGANAQLGAMLYILTEARYEQSPLPDALS